MRTEGHKLDLEEIEYRLTLIEKRIESIEQGVLENAKATLKNTEELTGFLGDFDAIQVRRIERNEPK